MSDREPLRFAIPEDDAFIERMLEDASIPTLMMSMIHMSGDASLLESDLRPAGAYINEYQGYMSEQDKAAVRAQALAVIKAFRDGGCQLPPPPAGGNDPPHDEFPGGPGRAGGLRPDDARGNGAGRSGPAFRRLGRGSAAQARKEHKVLVIGGGMSGVLAAYRLQEAGIPFVVIEKNPSVGGTWFENRYPGVRVDVGNHLYCYSFEPAHHWTQYFSQQKELQQYFEDVVRSSPARPVLPLQHRSNWRGLR